MRLLRIWDLDGCLADNDGTQSNKDFLDNKRALLEAPPVGHAVARAVQQLTSSGPTHAFNVCLTCRPLSVRDVTEIWLLKHGLAGLELVMREFPTKQYDEHANACFKRNRVEMLIYLFHPERVHVYDNCSANLEAIAKIKRKRVSIQCYLCNRHGNTLL